MGSTCSFFPGGSKEVVSAAAPAAVTLEDRLELFAPLDGAGAEGFPVRAGFGTWETLPATTPATGVVVGVGVALPVEVDVVRLIMG